MKSGAAKRGTAASRLASRENTFPSSALVTTLGVGAIFGMMHTFILGEHGADDDSCEAAQESTAGSEEEHPTIWCDADDDEAGDLGESGEDSDGGVMDLPVEAEKRHR